MSGEAHRNSFFLQTSGVWPRFLRLATPTSPDNAPRVRIVFLRLVAYNANIDQASRAQLL